MNHIIAITLLLGFIASACGQCSYYYMDSSTSSGTLITTSGYPNSQYNNYENDCWSFSTDFGGLTLTIRDLETESGLDELIIYDGSSTFSTELVSASGTGGSYDYSTYSSAGTNMYVTFDSDGSVTYDGFQACVCPSYASSCSCDYYDSGSSTWNSWSGSSSSSSLSTSAIIGLSVGIPLLILIPIIIGVSVACCAKTTASPTSYASRRAAGTLAPTVAGTIAAGTTYGGTTVITHATVQKGPRNQIGPYPMGVGVQPMVHGGQPMGQPMMHPPPYANGPPAYMDQQVVNHGPNTGVVLQPGMPPVAQGPTPGYAPGPAPGPMAAPHPADAAYPPPAPATYIPPPQ